MNGKTAAKIALFIAWPAIVFCLMAILLIGMIAAWFAIPFGTLKKSEGGEWEMKFGPDV